jgi:hypothetical protein
VDDIPRWASLLSPEDRSLFCEIVSQLWGIPAESTNSEWEGPFDRDEALSLLQELVNNLVRTSGLFDHESANSCGTYRLQSLRKLTFSLNVNHASKERHSLAEWDPFPTPEVQSSLPSDIPKPPDPEVKQSMVLARITILMAGAIFGTILLYLCRKHSVRPLTSTRLIEEQCLDTGFRPFANPFWLQELRTDQFRIR